MASVSRMHSKSFSIYPCQFTFEYIRSLNFLNAWQYQLVVVETFQSKIILKDRRKIVGAETSSLFISGACGGIGNEGCDF